MFLKERLSPLGKPTVEVKPKLRSERSLEQSKAGQGTFNKLRLQRP